MTGAMVAFGIAVAGAICYALMTRLQSRRGPQIVLRRFRSRRWQ